MSSSNVSSDDEWDKSDTEIDLVVADKSSDGTANDGTANDGPANDGTATMAMAMMAMAHGYCFISYLVARRFPPRSNR